MAVKRNIKPREIYNWYNVALIIGSLKGSFKVGTGVKRDHAKAQKFAILGVHHAYLDPSQVFVIFLKNIIFNVNSLINKHELIRIHC